MYNSSIVENVDLLLVASQAGIFSFLFLDCYDLLPMIGLQTNPWSIKAHASSVAPTLSDILY